MTVESRENGLQDEEWEFQIIDAVVQNRVGFEINNSEPPRYIRYDNRGAKAAERHAFGSTCVKCAEDNDFAHECPATYMDRSEIINPAIGDGASAEFLSL